MRSWFEKLGSPFSCPHASDQMIERYWPLGNARSSGQWDFLPHEKFRRKNMSPGTCWGHRFEKEKGHRVNGFYLLAGDNKVPAAEEGKFLIWKNRFNAGRIRISYFH